MEFFRQLTQIDFMGQRNLAICFSAILFLGSAIAIAINGLHLGLDFTGGTQVTVNFPHPVRADTIREHMKTQGIDNAVVQSYGNAHTLLIRFAPNNKQQQQQNQIKQTIQKALPDDATIERMAFIGPQVGKRLITHGILAIIMSLIITMAYIAMRFEYRFAISAAVSLIHDPILILGLFALFQLEFNLITLAALLTILGYSLNDTIVVYDRVRENCHHMRKANTKDIMNLSINQTLSRTIMTSGLTLLVVVALLLFGGETLKGFSIALIIGIIIGTYSSIYIAGALALLLGLNRKSLLPQTNKTTNNTF